VFDHAVSSEHFRPGNFKLDGCTVFATVPAGAILTVDSPLQVIGVPVEVDWAGQSVRMFPIDILDRGEVYSAASNARCGWWMNSSSFGEPCASPLHGSVFVTLYTTANTLVH
jgi:hypothetical protein